MKQRPRLSTWLNGSRQKPLRQNDSLYSDSTVDAVAASGANYLLAALRSRAPGVSSANTLELSRHLTSFVFLAINTLQKHAAAAEMKIMEETFDPENGDVEVPHTEPCYQLFKNPNSNDDWSDIADGLTQQISLTGIALEWTPPSDNGDVPSEVYVIPTATALPWPPSPIYPHGSYLIQPFYPLIGQRPLLAMAA